MNLSLLPKYFTNNISKRLNKKYKTTIDKKSYWHIRKGKKVLLVAHTDTVQYPFYRGYKDGIIYASGLDDRLGVFLGLTLLKERQDVDVLLTDLEETADSTINLVPPEDLADYNCIIGLDRAGIDFVDYGLADDILIDAYSDYATIGVGSFSDICFINEPPCGCINVGIGYERAHSVNSYAILKDFIKSYKDLNSFLDNYANTKFKAHKEESDYEAYHNFKDFPLKIYPEGCIGCGAKMNSWENNELCDKCRIAKYFVY